jgi:hypothetical protein
MGIITGWSKFCNQSNNCSGSIIIGTGIFCTISCNNGIVCCYSSFDRCSSNLKNGILNGFAYFYCSWNSGIINGFAYFYCSWNSGIINGTGNFYGYPIVANRGYNAQVGTICGLGIFNACTFNSGNIFGCACFTGLCSNNFGVISGQSCFLDDSRNSGIISGISYFNETAKNYGTGYGTGYFKNVACNLGCICGSICTY